MTKVFPNAAAILRSRLISSPSASASASASSSSETDENQTVLTVWKKSMLLNCDGFTVFNANGNLVYRVDNYISKNKAQILLMDSAGNPLFTIRRKRLSFAVSWLVFEGETSINPRFSVRKQVNILLKSKCLANVTSCSGIQGSCSASGKKKNDGNIMYEIEGCYKKRCCFVYDENRRIVAEIKRKEPVGGITFGFDVFRLVVHPQFDTALAMSLVILLDQMFGSSSSSS